MDPLVGLTVPLRRPELVPPRRPERITRAPALDAGRPFVPEKLSHIL